MLRREEQLRLAPETQAAFAACAVRVEDASDEHAHGVSSESLYERIDALQRRVAREFGVDEERGVAALRHAEVWVGAERARELSLYRRHNRCVDGPLAVGDRAPLGDVPPLARVAGGTLDLSSCEQPLVLVAGSLS